MAGSDRKALQDDLGQAEARLKELEREAAEARARIKALRAQLSPPPPSRLYEIEPPPRTVVRELNSPDKLSLFRQLFRGREDVFARCGSTRGSRRRGMRRHAPTSGSGASARSHASSAASAQVRRSSGSTTRRSSAICRAAM
jgi:hypothetical protein